LPDTLQNTTLILVT